MSQALLSVDHLKEQLGQPELVICDCRFDIHNPDYGYDAYLEGHIPGAQYVHLNQQLSLPPDGTNGRHPLPGVPKLVNMLRSLGVTNHSQVVVYDDEGGGYAARLWWILKYLGHQDVAVLDGGIPAWKAAGYSLSPDVDQPDPGDFEPEVREDRLIQVEELERELGRQVVLILDSRAPERYRGDEEPLDPIAGHIPGAINRYWADNLDTGDKFKTSEVLRAELEPLLEGIKVEDAVVYCGSGVTACHTLLAFELAGLPLPRLYAGSWSEWSSKPERGVETGSPGSGHKRST